MAWCSHTNIALLLIFLVKINNGVYCARPKGVHVRLAEDLLRDYGPKCSRPVYNFNQTVVVEFFLILNQVIELNERNQILTVNGQVEMEWKDEYLAWNTSQYPGVEVLNLPVSKIWKPDIHMYENLDFESSEDGLTMISPNGNVFWASPVLFTTSCRIDARFFPFDTQMCQVKFGSWVYPLAHIDLVVRSKRLISDLRKHFVENGVWDLSSLTIRREVTEYEGFGRYSDILCDIQLTRRPLFHVLTVLIPCALLSLINMMVFILPTESGEKVSLGISNVLALVLFQQLIGETMPPTSDQSPLISFYFTPMIITGCFSVVSGVVVAYFHHQHTSSDVPAWVSKLIGKFKVKKLQFNTRRQCEITSNETDALDKTPAKLITSDTENHVANMTKEGGYQTVEHYHSSTNHISINDEDKRRLTWKDVASLIDRLLLVTCVVITLVSMIVVAILFCVLR